MNTTYVEPPTGEHQALSSRPTDTGLSGQPQERAGGGTWRPSSIVLHRQAAAQLRKLIVRGGQVGRLLNFGSVGALVAGIGFIVLFFLVHNVGLDKNVAYFIQAVVAIELNFLLSHFFTWRDRRKAGIKSFAATCAKFHLTRVFTVAFNQVLFGVLVLGGLHYLVANAVCIAVTMVINYWIGDRFVFATARRRPEAVAAVSTMDRPSAAPAMVADLEQLDVVSVPDERDSAVRRPMHGMEWPFVSVMWPERTVAWQRGIHAVELAAVAAINRLAFSFGLALALGPVFKFVVH